MKCDQLLEDKTTCYMIDGDCPYSIHLIGFINSSKIHYPGEGEPCNWIISLLNSESKWYWECLDCDKN